LDSPKIEGTQRAEAHALRGRNAKQRWQDDWTTAGTPEEQRTAALRSKFLEDSWQQYGKGFEEDQNHYYSGLNALAMLTVLVELATSLPQVWAERFDDDTDAPDELARLGRMRPRLAGAVECSLEAARKRLAREGKHDPWLEGSMADLRCLISKRPERVAAAYRNAIAELKAFNLDSIRRQLLLYRQLGLLTANANAALALPHWSESSAPAAATNCAAPPHVVVFTGIASTRRAANTRGSQPTRSPSPGSESSRSSLSGSNRSKAAHPTAWRVPPAVATSCFSKFARNSEFPPTFTSRCRRMPFAKRP
jgi:hypothetical protein